MWTTNRRFPPKDGKRIEALFFACVSTRVPSSQGVCYREFCGYEPLVVLLSVCFAVLAWRRDVRVFSDDYWLHRRL